MRCESEKNCANLTMAITLSILNRFVKFFTAAKSDKFPTKFILVYHHTLSLLLHYLRKLKTICTDTFLETLSTLQLTSGESIFRHVSVQMVDILDTFCEQTHANNLHIICTCFWFKWHLPMVSDFYCVDV